VFGRPKRIDTWANQRGGRGGTVKFKGGKKKENPPRGKKKARVAKARGTKQSDRQITPGRRKKGIKEATGKQLLEQRGRPGQKKNGT